MVNVAFYPNCLHVLSGCFLELQAEYFWWNEEDFSGSSALCAVVLVAWCNIGMNISSASQAACESIETCIRSVHWPHLFCIIIMIVLLLFYYKQPLSVLTPDHCRKQFNACLKKIINEIECMERFLAVQPLTKTVIVYHLENISFWHTFPNFMWFYNYCLVTGYIPFLNEMYSMHKIMVNLYI